MKKLFKKLLVLTMAISIIATTPIAKTASVVEAKGLIGGIIDNRRENKPAAVTGIKVFGTLNISINEPLICKVTWDAQEGCDKYQVQMSKKANFFPSYVSETVAVYEYVYGAKIPEGYIRVRAHNRYGWGEWTSMKIKLTVDPFENIQ